MVVLNRIYTRSGDDGTTALATGERVEKCALRVEAYGTIDELNAVVGLCKTMVEGFGDLGATLLRVQHDLFDLGAELSTPEAPGGGEGSALALVQAQVLWLEERIDGLNGGLAPLRSFVLPGGHPLAAHLHLARTVCRRAERLLVGLCKTPGERVGAPALAYVNRLSDFFFVASRWVNAQGSGDVLWVPGYGRA